MWQLIFLDLADCCLAYFFSHFGPISAFQGFYNEDLSQIQQVQQIYQRNLSLFQHVLFCQCLSSLCLLNPTKLLVPYLARLNSKVFLNHSFLLLVEINMLSCSATLMKNWAHSFCARRNLFQSLAVSKTDLRRHQLGTGFFAGSFGVLLFS